MFIIYCEKFLFHFDLFSLPDGHEEECKFKALHHWLHFKPGGGSGDYVVDLFDI